eukprot:COSAG01_NODE_1131_length_11572_cov_84.273337_12_plen_86_part_00
MAAGLSGESSRVTPTHHAHVCHKTQGSANIAQRVWSRSRINTLAGVYEIPWLARERSCLAAHLPARSRACLPACHSAWHAGESAP